MKRIGLVLVSNPLLSERVNLMWTLWLKVKLHLLSNLLLALSNFLQ